jgi:septum formation protein
MKFKAIKPIILASSSLIRAKILADSYIDFIAISPFYDEDNEKKKLAKMSSKKLAMFLAIKKAQSVSEKYPDSYVIGCDQVCEFENQQFSKSQNLSQAIDQLTKFNGNIHYQNNATVIIFNGKIIYKNFSRVTLKMRKLTSSQIENYVNLDKPIGCAGSYKYESQGKHLFEKINGDYFAILGLSIQPLINFLHSQKIINL